MKLKIIIFSLLLFWLIPVVDVQAATPNSLKGRILLQVESKGEAWYVNPKDGQRYYLANGLKAFEIMRNLGIGISNKDWDRVKSDANFRKKFIGKILLQVESHGEAYYISFDGRYNYLQDGDSAFNIMRKLGLGISNKDLMKITTRNTFSLPPYPYSESVVYPELDQYCFDDDRIDLTGSKDFKLLKNGAETVVSSLKMIIKDYDTKKNYISCYESDIEIISISSDERYLYLNMVYAPYELREYVAGDLAEVYRLDLKDLTISSLALPANLDAVNGLFSEQYKILADGDRLVWWDRKGVNLFNMRKETDKRLYSFSGNEWPIASVHNGLVTYNIQVKDGTSGSGSVIINVYNKNVTEEGYSTKGEVGTDDNFYVDYPGYDQNIIKLKFIKQISVPIPN